jgi:dihydroflavonol-4-reductase
MLIQPPDKIFVTGGTGFLGAYLIRELLGKGYRVKALRRTDKLPVFFPAAVFDPVEWVQGDVLDIHSLETGMEGTDAVVHSAAVVSFTPGANRDMFRTNIDGTANVVNAALKTGIRKFLHISSVAALGKMATAETVDESAEWEDSPLNTRYGKSKYAGEMEVWRGIGEGLNAVIVNPSTILGYGDWKTSSCAIFKNVYDGFPWYSTGTTGFVAVTDVAVAAIRLLESGISGERFLLNTANWSFREVFNCIADAFGKKHPGLRATPRLAAIAWRIEKVKSMFTGRPPLLTKETAKLALATSRFDNSKVGNALPGFTFTPLETCIGDACNHYLQEI